ncbi:MAG: hypothetical protein KDC71_24705 [Acidobacteria bacterium]|nr:hypothetical protein [Acidobacteriota bacterium]
MTTINHQVYRTLPIPLIWFKAYFKAIKTYWDKSYFQLSFGNGVTVTYEWWNQTFSMTFHANTLGLIEQSFGEFIQLLSDQERIQIIENTEVLRIEQATIELINRMLAHAGELPYEYKSLPWIGDLDTCDLPRFQSEMI